MAAPKKVGRNYTLPVEIIELIEQKYSSDEKSRWAAVTAGIIALECLGEKAEAILNAVVVANRKKAWSDLLGKIASGTSDVCRSIGGSPASGPLPSGTEFEDPQGKMEQDNLDRQRESHPGKTKRGHA